MLFMDIAVPRGMAVLSRRVLSCSPVFLTGSFFCLLLLIQGCKTGMGPLPDPPERPDSGQGIKVVVLGSAQDAGIPQLGCRCLHCRKALDDPKWERRVSSLGIINSSTGEVAIIDATPDICAQVGRLLYDPLAKVRGRRKPVDAILLTHAHMGHYSGLVHFGPESASSQRIPVFATPRMLDFLNQNLPFSQLFQQGNLIPRPVRDGEFVEVIRGVRVKPLRVPHRDEFSDTVGFVIEGPEKKLLYIPDIDSWDRWNRSIVEEVGAVDYALLDGTFYSPEELPDRDLSEIPHPLITSTMKKLGPIANGGKVKVYFTHLNHSNPVHRDSTKEHQEVLSSGFFVVKDGHEFWL